MITTASGQSIMEVVKKSGGSERITIDAITKVTFTQTDMVVGGAGSSIAIDNIYKIIFNDDSTTTKPTPSTTTGLMEKIYPNPFNPTTTVSFNMHVAGKLTIEIYNGLGQKIKTVFKGPKAAGYHNLSWDGTDDKGTGVGTGAYLMHMVAGNQKIDKVLTLIK